MTDHIEQATAAPGEKRNTLIPCRCKHNDLMHSPAVTLTHEGVTTVCKRPCARCRCKDFRPVGQ